jgi:hypothetical protein
MTITVARASAVAPRTLCFTSASLITSPLARASLFAFFTGLADPRSMLTYFEDETLGVH